MRHLFRIIYAIFFSKFFPDKWGLGAQYFTSCCPKSKIVVYRLSCFRCCKGIVAIFGRVAINYDLVDIIF